MYTWAGFPFVRFSFAGIAGILVFERFPGWWSAPGITLLALLALLFGLRICGHLTRFSLVAFPQGLH